MAVRPGQLNPRSHLLLLLPCVLVLSQVQQLMERRNMMAPGERGDRVQLPANCFAYAGMTEMLTKEQKAYYDSLFAR
jgi:hypothetical protein